MLDISPLIMAVTFVIFLTMLYLLNQKLYKPLLKFMDDRDATLSRELKEAQSLSTDSSDLTQQAQARIDDAKAQAAKMRQEALEKLQQEQARALENRTRELAEKYESFKTTLAGEKEALREKLLAQMPTFKQSLQAKLAQL